MVAIWANATCSVGSTSTCFPSAETLWCIASRVRSPIASRSQISGTSEQRFFGADSENETSAQTAKKPARRSKPSAQPAKAPGRPEVHRRKRGAEKPKVANKSEPLDLSAFRPNPSLSSKGGSAWPAWRTSSRAI